MMSGNSILRSSRTMGAPRVAFSLRHRYVWLPTIPYFLESTDLFPVFPIYSSLCTIYFIYVLLVDYCTMHHLFYITLPYCLFLFSMVQYNATRHYTIHQSIHTILHYTPFWWLSVPIYTILYTIHHPTHILSHNPIQHYTIYPIQHDTTLQGPTQYYTLYTHSIYSSVAV